MIGGPPLFDHLLLRGVSKVLHRRASGVVRGSQVDVQDEVPCVLVHVVEGAVAGDPRVVHNHVDLAEPAGRGGHQVTCLVLADRVVDGDHGIPTGLLDQPGGLFGRVLIHVVDSDGRAFLREPNGGGPPDPAPRPGDHGHLAVESSHDCSFRTSRMDPRARRLVFDSRGICVVNVNDPGTYTGRAIT